MYLAADPGKNTGLAAFNERGFVEWMQPVAYSELAKTLTAIQGKVTTCIIEDFRPYGHKTDKLVNQQMWAAQAIGVIEAWCQLNEVKVVKQLAATAKPIAYKWLKIKPPSNKQISHAMDAYVHGIYWLVKNNILDIGNLVK